MKFEGKNKNYELEVQTQRKLGNGGCGEVYEVLVSTPKNPRSSIRMAQKMPICEDDKKLPYDIQKKVFDFVKSQGFPTLKTFVVSKNGKIILMDLKKSENYIPLNFDENSSDLQKLQNHFRGISISETKNAIENMFENIQNIGQTKMPGFDKQLEEGKKSQGYLSIPHYDAYFLLFDDENEKIKLVLGDFDQFEITDVKLHKNPDFEINQIIFKNKLNLLKGLARMFCNISINDIQFLGYMKMLQEMCIKFEILSPSKQPLINNERIFSEYKKFVQSKGMKIEEKKLQKVFENFMNEKTAKNNIY